MKKILYLNTKQVSILLGVEKKIITRWWKKRNFSFPHPVAMLKDGPVFSQKDIERWKMFNNERLK